MLEAAVLIDVNDAPIYWHTPEDRTVGSLPDNHTFWEHIWNNRENLLGMAHTHPGSGMPHPSSTDISTFRALEAALGLGSLLWWIASSDKLICVLLNNPKTTPSPHYSVIEDQDEPEWLVGLRKRSHYNA